MKSLLTSPVGQFLHDIKSNRLFGELVKAFEREYGRRPSFSERNSWDASLPRLAGAIELANLADDTIVGLEAQVPYYGQRIDATLFGLDKKGGAHVVLIELKQWSHVELLDEGSLSVHMGRATVASVHPSLQVEGYRRHLLSFCRAFHEKRVELSCCVYAHNYPSHDGALFDACFSEALRHAQVFAAEDTDHLSRFLREKLSGGSGKRVLDEVINRGIAPSKELADFASDLVRKQDVFTMLDNQIPAQRAIVSAIRVASRSSIKSVILVQGGPGTGKSVIALDALGMALRKGYRTYVVSGSAAFTSGLRKLLGNELSGMIRFTDFFWNFEPDSVDVLIVDEAHRIRAKSLPRVATRFRPVIPQLEELVRAAKVSVLLMDPKQIIEPTEVGDPRCVAEVATNLGCKYSEFHLTSQFRCDGSDTYLTWVDRLFELEEGAPGVLDRSATFDLAILDTPQDLLSWVRSKNELDANSSRFVAGWCWPWSDPRQDRSLVEDIVVGDFRFPWELKNGKKGPQGIPEARHWAVDPTGAGQAGTVYSVQGFEFRNLAVLMGRDLVVRNGRWAAFPEFNFRTSLRSLRDGSASGYIRRIYRTLFTRPLQSIRVCSVDAETQAFLTTLVRAQITTAT